MNFLLSLLAVMLGLFISGLFCFSIVKTLVKCLKIPKEIATENDEACWVGTDQDLKFSLFVKNLIYISRWGSIASLLFLFVVIETFPSVIFLLMAFARPVVSICLIGLALQSRWLFAKIVNFHVRN